MVTSLSVFCFIFLRILPCSLLFNIFPTHLNSSHLMTGPKLHHELASNRVSGFWTCASNNGPRKQAERWSQARAVLAYSRLTGLQTMSLHFPSYDNLLSITVLSCMFYGIQGDSSRSTMQSKLHLGRNHVGYRLPSHKANQQDL